MTPRPSLNPHLDVDKLRETWREDERVRIDDFLDPNSVQAIVDACRGLPFDYIFFNQGKNYVVPEQSMAAMTPQQRQTLQHELLEQASRGVGFFYNGYRLEGERLASAPQALKDLFELINSEQVVGLMQAITGLQNLAPASGHFSRYSSGQYLTRHSDNITEEHRKLAYVLNLTPEWHPDWGGLLQFYEQNGTPRDAWEPRLNSLSLFDVRHVHAVTYVTPFALAPRYALAGWYRDR